MRLRGLSFLALCLGGASCVVGPSYRVPPTEAPTTYKELADWTIAIPMDTLSKGSWWTIYDDPLLDSLESQVNSSNQTVGEFEAQYREALALVKEAQSGLYPTVGVSTGITQSGSGFGTAANINTLEGSADWTPDIWGQVRREIESEASAAQASAAELAFEQLSAQATLATDYFDLRSEDSLAQVLQATVAAFQRSLTITENQYKAGTESDSDVVQAQAQLQTVIAELTGVGATRATFEHAIAVLTGHPPADLSIPPSPLPEAVPVIPPGLPSTLLERRPDVASAERAMQEENAQIGVAIAAYYPTISLSALGGFAGSPIGSLLNVSDRVWSLGVAASDDIFEGGLRSAQVNAARAAYDNAVATYRQTVLTAFQNVEDALADLRIDRLQAQAIQAAIVASQRAVQVALNEYLAGTEAYTTVVTEQEQLLTNEQSAVTVLQERLVASVDLIQALGGGWTTGDLPSQAQVRN
jgi:NodT family efflux transporter outer membrane factor (OMF) lipoprotein